MHPISACRRASPLSTPRFQDIFVDASLKVDRAGIGVNYHTRREFEKYSLVRRPDRRPDSNHAELAAIFVALLHSRGSRKTRIFTDSQTSIGLIREGTLDPRFAVLVGCSRWLLAESGETLLFKVKGHSGVPGNELAHRLATMGRRGGAIVLPDYLIGQAKCRDRLIPALIDECSCLNQWQIESFKRTQAGRFRQGDSTSTGRP
jgi:ribonuclease HI